MHIPQDITQRIGLEPIFFDDQGSLKGQDSSITSPPELTGKKFTDELNAVMNPQTESIDEKSDKEQPISNQRNAEKTSFTVRDFIDIINPLQHIPIVGTLYRNITHDEIKAPSRILGGGLFGGIVGAVAGLVNTISDKITGKDIGEHALTLLQDNDGLRNQEALVSSEPEVFEKPLYTLTEKTPLTNEKKMKVFESYQHMHQFENEKNQEGIGGQELDLYL